METKEFTNEQAHRLLVCWREEPSGKKSGAVMYKMRPYTGVPEYDMELIDILERHKAKNPDHEMWRGMIFRTDKETASKLDAETAIKNELKSHDLYISDFRDELKVDALRCFNKHDRPKDSCIDWCDESKTIGRKTGVPLNKRQYLCMYCPCASYVAHKERKELGIYDIDVGKN